MEYVAIVLLNLVVYYRSLKFGLCVDDISNRNLDKNPEKRKLWLRVLRMFDGRGPVKSIPLDHAITIFIHTLTCVLMQVAFNCLPATLLFAVFIGNNQVSVWLNGKRYGIAACLCLLSYILAPLGAIVLLLVPFFQVSGLLFPFVLALKGCWYVIPLFALMLLVGNKYIINWANSRKRKCSNEWYKKFTLKKIPYILKTYAFYFFRAIIPMPPAMYIDYHKKVGLGEEYDNKACKFDLASLAGLVIVLGIPILYKVLPDIMFGAMWWLILISVWNNAITYTTQFGERYMYLPNIGLFVTLIQLLNLINPHLWLVLFGYNLALTIIYLPMYKDLVSYLHHHIYTNPENDISWNFLCNLASDVKNVISVLYLTEQGLKSDKSSKLLWLHRAGALHMLNHHEQALQCLEEAKKGLEPRHTEQFALKIEQLKQQIKKVIKEK